ncbi:MAG: methyltransferase [Clostridia bacterium]|nr:methyltransferase [Clostridia bacterium]
MELLDNERLDYVNDSISLIQKTDGLTFGTDALLLAGYIRGKSKRGLEIGGGTGIISMLLAARCKIAATDTVEVQKEYAELIERNIALNNLCEKIRVIHADIRALPPSEEYDIVFTNPPYMKTDSGKLNENDAKSAARHEVNGGIAELIFAGSRLLKWGGALVAVYRPDRLMDILSAMREAKLEPKRLTLVQASAASKPSMVLIESKKGGKSGIKVTRPLIIYKNGTSGEYSEDMNFIMNTGDFPEDFYS